MSVIRTFGIQAIGAASQPVFGTTLNGAGVLTPDPFAFPPTTGPSANPSISILTVVAVTGLRTGDRVAVAPKTTFVLGGVPDTGTILAIDISNKKLTVQGLLNAHASGDYVVLDNAAAGVWVIPVALTGVAYLGQYETVAVGDASTFDRLPIYNGTGVPYVHSIVSGSQFSPLNLVEYWIQGTNTDTFLARWVEF